MSTTIKISALPTKTRIAAGDYVPIVDNDGTPTTKKVYGDAFTPVGTYIQFAGSSAPGGYLACDGTAVSRTTYADLFAVVSTTYGVGDGSTTFNLPDARGLVMVGAGAHGTMTRANGTPYNGGSVGAARDDQAQGHWHDWYVGNTANSFGHNDSNDQIATADDAGGRKLQSDGSVSGSKDQINAPISDGTNGTPRTGDETRPAEIAVLVCIKT